MPYSQLGDMIQHLDALGLTNYQALTLPGEAHSFSNWSPVKEQALAFLANGFAGRPPPPPVPGNPSKKLINVSTRANVGTSEDVMICGFIVTGAIDKRVVLRGIGPSLGLSGLNGLLADPMMELYDEAGVLIEVNDNRVAIPGLPNPLLPANSSESFLTAILPPGRYTAVLHGVGSTTGLALVELYDMDPEHSNVSNISTRGNVGPENDKMIGGFIVGGADPTQVLVRALGPSLASFGISSPLPNPALELHDGNGNLLSSNDNWRSDQEQQILASKLAPSDNRESAIVATLQPGSYTAVVYDAGLATGVALVEAYNLEP